MSKHQAPVGIGTRDEAIRHVMALVAEECSDETCLIKPVLEQCVAHAVDSRWQEGGVTNFVPILAFREVQECIRNGSCPDLEESLQA
jgi:ribosomal protein S2